MKTKLTAIVLAVVMLLTIGIFAGCSNQAKTDENNNEAQTVSIVLIDKDKQEFKYELHAKEGTNLKQALFDEGLITEETFYAMFVEDIDGHVADVFNDGCTWLPKDEDGNQIMGNFDEITVTPGQTITLEYYKVPDMD